MSRSKSNPSDCSAEGSSAGAGCDTSVLPESSTPLCSERRRLRAPRENKGVFADPPLADIGRQIEANRSQQSAAEYDCQGRSFANLRRQTRLQAIEEAERFTSQWRDVERFGPGADERPLLAAGHQPELFHPGVWAKNFVLDFLARSHGAVSLHLVVDNDTIKTTSLRVPSGTPKHPVLDQIPFDAWQNEQPWEELEIRDRALFEGFGRQVTKSMAGYPFKPAVESFWHDVCEHSWQTSRLAECFTAARNRLEHRWGASNLELPLSRLCRLEGFYWFASHVLAQLPRFRAVHNEALAEYRRRNRIRSHNHPVPALAEQEGWNEAPFWVWSLHDTRRRRLFARQQGGEVLLSDGREQFAALPLKPDGEACCAVEELARLSQRGIKLRTRALTTTLFSRLILSDLFIHGIGGAKYDELADEIIRRFFGFEPPGFLTLSATMHLPVEPFGVRAEDLRQLDRLERDLLYNPDRHLSDEAAGRDEVRAIVHQKREAIAGQPVTSLERGRRFRHIRALNASLEPWVAPEREALSEKRGLVQEQWQANRILTNREFAFCLYPEELLREFYSKICSF